MIDMNILVIKQTSLGDVLHISGHLRTIKENFPNARVYLLTTLSASEIYHHNKWVDEIILFDYSLVKKNLFKRPQVAWREIMKTAAKVRAQDFDMAFDLQGLARSVLFLYCARAAKKYVKGKWWGLNKFRDPKLPALKELDGVLHRAGLTVKNTAMEFFISADATKFIDGLLAEINSPPKPILIFAPYSRWQSKNWELQRYIEIAVALQDDYTILFCGAADNHDEVAAGLAAAQLPAATNLAGKINLTQFAALVRTAELMLCGDSFPMHLGVAMDIKVVALFAPTDERRTGPGAAGTVIRAPGCIRCDRAGCKMGCMQKLSTQVVLQAMRQKLQPLAN